MSGPHAPGTRSFRPGEWFGIFGERATVILPPSEKDRVAGLWEMIDAGAGFDETLDALISSGLRQLPAFLLVSTAEGETKVVLRGAARASFVADGGTVDLEGLHATTWVERTLTGVTSMSVQVDDDSVLSPDATDLTLVGGLVRVCRVDEPPYSSELVEEPAPVAVAEDEPEVEAEAAGFPTDDEAYAASDDPVDHAEQAAEEHVDDAAQEWDDEPEPTSEEIEELDQPDGSDEPDEPDEEMVTQAWAPSSQSVPAPPVPPAPVEAVTPPPPGAPGVPATDHDGMTQAGGWNPGEFARQRPGIPGQPQAPDVTRPVAVLSFSSGERVEVDRAILVGRAPEARRFTSTDQPRLVTVPSPQQEISSTHLEVRPGSGADHGSAVVTDMGSTNGTVLVQPGLAPEDLQPGMAVQLIPGAIIDLGDGVTIQVSNP